MKLLRAWRFEHPLAQEVVAAIGNFDGVHLGHQALLSELCSESRRLNLPSMVILFEPQATEYFLKEKAPARLTSLRKKLALLKQHGIAYVCCISFNATVAHLSPNDFVEDLLFKQLRVRTLLVGADFRFGQGRSGDVCLLNELLSAKQANLHIFPEYQSLGARVSSTRIRALLAAGDLLNAEALLARPYAITGRVVHGDARGRTFGVPTANILLKSKMLPLTGVYCVKVTTAEAQFKAVANIGMRPTIGGLKPSLEVHLLDETGDFYGQIFDVEFLYKLRDERKFESLDALIAQIHEDVAIARTYWENSSIVFVD